MQITLTPEEQMNLQKQVQTCRQVRHWKRYQALLLLAEAIPPEQVARVLHCSRASVYNWAADFRRQGRGALTEHPHGGRPADLDQAALKLLDHWLEEGNPQQHGYAATNWTVPLLQTQLGQSGYQVSQKTIRRALHRLGWRWKRPKYVLGRPDPDYTQKKPL